MSFEQIITHQSRMSDMFRDELHYRIPKFQREYSWKDTHIDEFMEDLTTQYDDIQKGKKINMHFFGPMMFIEHEDTKWTVVDGQQRLTTSMLFFIVIRNLYKKYNKTPEFDLEIINNALYNTETKSKSLRLELGYHNNDVFTLIHDANQLSDISINTLDTRNKLLLKAALRIESTLNTIIKNFDNDQKFLYLKGLYNHFGRYFVIVRMQIKNEGSAYRIFDSMNNRGKKLTQSELVKNLLLESIDKLDSAHIQDWYKKWVYVQKKLNDTTPRIDEDLFLKQYLIVNHKSNDISQANVFNNIVTKIKHEHYSPKTMIDDLVTFSKNYRELKTPLGLDESTKEKLLDLNLLSAKAVYPPLLKCHKLLQDKKINNDTFLKIIDMITIFFFRVRTILRTTPGKMEKFFAGLCHTIMDDISSITINDILKQSELYPTNNLFIENFKISCDDMSPNIAKYVLYKIEHNITSKTKLEYASTRSAKLEHIDLTISQEFDNLGNLTLTNENIPNDSWLGFENKCSIHYKIDDFLITRNICEYQLWNYDSIMSRKNKLLSDKRIQEIWSL